MFKGCVAVDENIQLNYEEIIKHSMDSWSCLITDTDKSPNWICNTLALVVVLGERFVKGLESEFHTGNIFGRIIF